MAFQGVSFSCFLQIKVVLGIPKLGCRLSGNGPTGGQQQKIKVFGLENDVSDKDNRTAHEKV